MEFTPAQTVIDYVKRDFGFGYRQSSHFSETKARGLTQKELNAIK